MGWLKWREFGRRGDTARDQVIQAQPLELKRAPVVPPSWSDGIPKQVLLPTLGPSRGRVEGDVVTHQTSDQRRLPAEFKHITKRRRRN